ncbi:MAG: hypothetical protein WBB76_07990 [Gaiellaceae bacterium]
MPVGTCRLKETLGEAEPCPEKRCPFWEAHVSSAGCAFGRLQLDGRPELATFLLEVRDELESARTRVEATDARRLFFERLNAGRAD